MNISNELYTCTLLETSCTYEKYAIDGTKQGRIMRKETFDNKEIFINDLFDYINLKNIVVNEPDNNFKIIKLEMTFYDKPIFLITFDLWRNINSNFEIKKDKNIIYNLSIPWDKFLLKDKLLSNIPDLGHTNIPNISHLNIPNIGHTNIRNIGHQNKPKIKITYEGNCESINLYYETVLITKDEKKKIANTHIQPTLYKFLQEHSYPIKENSNIPLSGYYSGFYVTGFNLDDLESFQLIINQYIMMDYNKTEVNLFFKKINNNCVYIPLNCDKENDNVTNAGITFFNTRTDLNFMKFGGIEFKGMCYALTKNAFFYKEEKFQTVVYEV